VREYELKLCRKLVASVEKQLVFCGDSVVLVTFQRTFKTQLSASLINIQLSYVSAPGCKTLNEIEHYGVLGVHGA